MRTDFYQVAFYFRSSCPDHLRTLEVLHSALGTFQKLGQASVLEFDCDLPGVVLPEYIPALPCMSREEPLPRRVIVGLFKTAVDISSVLGLPPEALSSHITR